MKLKDIRIANIQEIKRAVTELAQSVGTITLGEFHATSRTIMARGKQLGLSTEDLNKLAQGKDLDMTTSDEQAIEQAAQMKVLGHGKIQPDDEGN